MEYKQQLRKRQVPSGRGKGKSKQQASGGANASIPGSSVRNVMAGFSVRSHPLFGLQRRCRLNYYFSGTVTSGAGSAGAYVFSANGLYDPDITSTGGQPMGFDQMISFYNHYTVQNSAIKVVFMSNSATLRATCALMASGDSALIANPQQVVENGDVSFSKLSYAGTAADSATFTRSMNIGRFQGVVNSVDQPNLSGSVGTNPAEQSYYHLMVWNPASLATISCDFEGMIEFDVIFREPRKAPIS